MQAISDWLISLGAWNWLIFSVIFFIFETFIPGVYFIWFGVAAALVGVIALSVDITWQWQFVLFGSIALLSVLVVRQYAHLQFAAANDSQLNERGNSYVGRVVEIEDAIVGGRGRARVADSIWSVEGPDMPAGSKAKVLGSKGTVLIVDLPDSAE